MATPSVAKMIRIIGPKDKTDKNEIVINTTSCSKTWSRGLSPFYLGPCKLYGNKIANNVENGWQFAKVYPEHVDENGDPNKAYWRWAYAGWQDKRAQRYPMGKGATPLYSFWNNEKLSYVEARKKIYIPLYANAVRDTEAFATLKKAYEMHENITLWDFDGWDYHDLGLKLTEVPDIEIRKMGHAFVLAMLLEGKI